MALNLSDLNNAGGFISDQPIKRTITFKLDDGVEHTGDIHVKRLSIGDHEKLFMSVTDKQSKTALLISHVITLGEDGKERISFEKAYKLHPALAAEMIKEYQAVNNGGEKN